MEFGLVDLTNLSMGDEMILCYYDVVMVRSIVTRR